MPAGPKIFKKIYEDLTAPVSKKYDCGKYCAPLNEGEPVCCSTRHAVPIVTRAEWSVLKDRTKMWSKFKPYDATTREIADELSTDCKAIECKGARFCERDNRTLACRAFPFFPYMNKENEIAGLSIYWTFEDRCWVMSNLQIVDAPFVDQLISAYELLFENDEEERETFVGHSASMRRVYSRRAQIIPILARRGKYYKVLPKSGGKIIPAKLSEFKAIDPFTSFSTYKQTVRDLGGETKNLEWASRKSR